MIRFESCDVPGAMSGGVVLLIKMIVFHDCHGSEGCVKAVRSGVGQRQVLLIKIMEGCW